LIFNCLCGLIAEISVKEICCMPNSSKGSFLLAFLMFTPSLVPCIVLALLLDIGTVGQRALAGIVIALLICFAGAYFTTRRTI
jgi:hypothetical protein